MNLFPLLSLCILSNPYLFQEIASISFHVILGSPPSPFFRLFTRRGNRKEIIMYHHQLSESSDSQLIKFPISLVTGHPILLSTSVMGLVQVLIRG